MDTQRDVISRVLGQLCLPQFCLGVGDDFKGPFAPEGFEIIPESDKVFVHVS